MSRALQVSIWDKSGRNRQNRSVLFLCVIHVCAVAPVHVLITPLGEPLVEGAQWHRSHIAILSGLATRATRLRFELPQRESEMQLPTRRVYAW